VKKHVWTRGRSGSGVAGAPSARFGHSVIVFGTKLLVFGGHNGHECLNDTLEYNVETNAWLPVAVSGSRPAPRFAHRGVFHENRLVVFGGSNGLVRFNDVWQLDLSRPGAYVWRELPCAARPTERASPACLVAGARLVLVGGHDGARSNECYELDLHAALWRPLAVHGRMPFLSEHSAVLCGERVLLFGGAASSTSLSDELFELDLQRLTVRQVPTRGPRPAPRMGHVAALLGGGQRMVVFGGRGETGANLNDVHVLQLDSFTWQPVPTRPGRRNRVPQPRAYAGGAVFKDFLYVVGGLDGQPLDSLWTVNLVVQGDASRRAPDGIRELKLAREKGLGRACFGCGNKFKMFKKRVQCSACAHVFCGHCFTAGVAHPAAVAAPDDGAASDSDSDGDDDGTGAGGGGGGGSSALQVHNARDVCRDCRKQQVDASDATHQRYRYAPSATQLERRKRVLALRQKPLDKFSVDDVGLWLGTIGLQRYADKFRSNAIDGAMLPELTVERLRQYCGMTDGLHSRSFFTAVARLRRGERAVNEYADVASWTPQQVADWTAEVDLWSLAPMLGESCVHGALLRSLTDDDLRALGVDRPLLRKKLLLCVSRLLNPPPLSPLAQVGVEQIASWLTAHGLGQYVDVFRANAIDGICLSLLTDALLGSELSVQSEWHRRSMLAGFAALLEKLERPADDYEQQGNAMYWSMLLALQWCDAANLAPEWRAAMLAHALHGAVLLVLSRRHVADILGTSASASAIDAVANALADLQQLQIKRFGAARLLAQATSTWSGAAFAPAAATAPPPPAPALAAVAEIDSGDDDVDVDGAAGVDGEGDGPVHISNDDDDDNDALLPPPPRAVQSAASLMARVDARRAAYQPLARMNTSDSKAMPARALPAKPSPVTPNKSNVRSQLQQWEASVQSNSPAPVADGVGGDGERAEDAPQSAASLMARVDARRAAYQPLARMNTTAEAKVPAPVAAAAAAAATTTTTLPALPVRALPAKPLPASPNKPKAIVAAAPAAATSSPAAEERPSLAALQRIVSATSAATTVAGSEAGGSSAKAALTALDGAGKRQLSGEELLSLYKSAIPARYHITFAELLKEAPQKIGEGAHGVVFKCQYRSVSVAVKQLKNVSLHSPELREFVGEAVLMAELKPHPQVVSFLGLCLEPLCLVVEFLARGSLGVMLADRSIALPIARKLSFVRDIAAGMLHLSLEKVVHKDLAARNVLVGQHWEAKVSDFGMSRILSETNNEHFSAREVGPLKWMAPESLKENRYSTLSDVWSFAVTVVEILTRQEPYPNLDIVRFATQFFIENLTLMNDVPDECPPALRQLLARCFVHDAEKRPTFHVICDTLKKMNEGGAGDDLASTRE
jgi:hypothetical protein